jgi:hypothetical protein
VDACHAATSEPFANIPSVAICAYRTVRPLASCPPNLVSHSANCSSARAAVGSWSHVGCCGCGPSASACTPCATVPSAACPCGPRAVSGSAQSGVGVGGEAWRPSTPLGWCLSRWISAPRLVRCSTAGAGGGRASERRADPAAGTLPPLCRGSGERNCLSQIRSDDSATVTSMSAHTAVPQASAKPPRAQWVSTLNARPLGRVYFRHARRQEHGSASDSRSVPPPLRVLGWGCRVLLGHDGASSHASTMRKSGLCASDAKANLHTLQPPAVDHNRRLPRMPRMGRCGCGCGRSSEGVGMVGVVGGALTPQAHAAPILARRERLGGTETPSSVAPSTVLQCHLLAGTATKIGLAPRHNRAVRRHCRGSPSLLTSKHKALWPRVPRPSRGRSSIRFQVSALPWCSPHMHAHPPMHPRISGGAQTLEHPPTPPAWSFSEDHPGGFAAVSGPE